jgi:hypothetical protein
MGGRRCRKLDVSSSSLWCGEDVQGNGREHAIGDVTRFNPNDARGHTSRLSEKALDDLVEHLLSL